MGFPCAYLIDCFAGYFMASLFLTFTWVFFLPITVANESENTHERIKKCSSFKLIFSFLCKN